MTLKKMLSFSVMILLLMPLFYNTHTCEESSEKQKSEPLIFLDRREKTLLTIHTIRWEETQKKEEIFRKKYNKIVEELKEAPIIFDTDRIQLCRIENDIIKSENRSNELFILLEKAAIILEKAENNERIPEKLWKDLQAKRCLWEKSYTSSSESDKEKIRSLSSLNA